LPFLVPGIRILDRQMCEIPGFHRDVALLRCYGFLLRVPYASYRILYYSSSSREGDSVVKSPCYEKGINIGVHFTDSRSSKERLNVDFKNGMSRAFLPLNIVGCSRKFLLKIPSVTGCYWFRLQGVMLFSE